MCVLHYLPVAHDLHTPTAYYLIYNSHKHSTPRYSISPSAILINTSAYYDNLL